MKTKLNGIEGGVAENGVWTLETMKREWGLIDRLDDGTWVV
jgi:hypothetical protein